MKNEDSLNISPGEGADAQNAETKAQGGESYSGNVVPSIEGNVGTSNEGNVGTASSGGDADISSSGGDADISSSGGDMSSSSNEESAETSSNEGRTESPSPSEKRHTYLSEEVSYLDSGGNGNCPCCGQSPNGPSQCNCQGDHLTGQVKGADAFNSKPVSDPESRDCCNCAEKVVEVFCHRCECSFCSEQCRALHDPPSGRSSEEDSGRAESSSDHRRAESSSDEPKTEDVSDSAKPTFSVEKTKPFSDKSEDPQPESSNKRTKPSSDKSEDGQPESSNKRRKT